MEVLGCCWCWHLSRVSSLLPVASCQGCPQIWMQQLLEEHPKAWESERLGKEEI